MTDEQPHLAHRLASRLFDNDSPNLDRFGVLLAFTIMSVAALSLIDLKSIENDLARGLAALALSFTTGVTLVLALRAAGVVQRWRRVAEILVVVAAIANIIALTLSLSSDIETSLFRSSRPSPIWVIIALVSPVAVLHRLLQHRRATVRTLAGAVAAYLLIALAGCYVFFTIDSLVEGGFFGVDDVASHEFMYFSLVTITTLGYGDLTAAEPVGRLATTTVAVVGQVYLVTFVAMVVGLMIQQRGDEE